MTDNGNDLSIPVNENDHIQGNPDAPLVLVEYGDYECIHCRRAYPVIKKLQRHLGDDLCFVFRNFPLGQSHPHAQHAAEASEIADQAGKFWEYHDHLYEHQEALDDASLQAYAEQFGIAAAEFSGSLENEEFRDKVQKSFLSGVESGVNGTPSFFVNGSRYDGDWEYEPFIAYLSSLK
ncbi:Protein-disulfide isomerase [Pedobacter westerhofensis]|uniref:Protein-disulfide isomerase n=1 Tax=Pedobacter westerhofensis TaxID=425512 RepID=A0A521FH72_9SPHI|nr:DsbA family protein [Pedobacter westerhofensis]SMO95542.1 Protein-disulfide isomerase [Pedobacter westerhofensis]